MKQKIGRVYRRRNPWKIIGIVLAAMIIAAVVLAVGIFFGFKKYAVYTPDGVYLDVPWLEETIES